MGIVRIMNGRSVKTQIPDVLPSPSAVPSGPSDYANGYCLGHELKPDVALARSDRAAKPDLRCAGLGPT